ncbi:Coenzyme F420 hydrogenase/dehydrogenase, beta subunit C-terminal domain [Acetobacterium woodii]|uniref:F420 reducing hydrogenase subunit beta n=1 Tax=Acetobacterium woodii (strain ATCC 29683 / DSM 1030 / JCM 2381 / KCTC 1655 / WB1) TaxID=931626 RepID=H6LEM1_ACEWD|nr:Coenzyme F420 hydrogenase/dehydrogenase, beta subunit C-terminal domain [Acetobacterium woodii]AFA48124.1 F420 reducing hydrogenase subunit beta [Acetobacterium woodii DSM 1030]
MKKDQIIEYCTGCGLCHSVNDTRFQDEPNGFTYPVIENNEQLEFNSKICQANGTHLLKQDDTTWGHYFNVYSGYSTDTEIRFKAASGGMTTAVAVYLAERGLVDGVIQVGEDPDSPYGTKNFVSKTKEEIVSHCGSRYIVSSPLANLQQVLSNGGKYAVIGRPCDIVVLNNYLDNYPQFKENIYCTLTFFCAGSPSVEASKKLAKRLEIEPESVTKIRYRGYGWPGKATVFSEDKENHMEYIDSWNQILGRDIRKICKLCTDGVGEAADIASGDLWNLADNKPVFNETDGVNVVFARSEKGRKILEDAVKKGYIHLEDYASRLKELDFVQPNHSNRKKLLYPRFLGMKLMGKTVPNYDMNKLKQYCKDEPKIKVMKTTLGTVKRVLKGKL